jgi:hypothetical protein
MLEHIKLSDLIPYVNNAKTHPEEQVTKIAASIKEFGPCSPILVDKDNGIVAGHGRLLAAKKLGLDTFPCVRLEHLNEAQRKAYILADNRLGEVGGSEWDTGLVSLELEWLEGEGFDIDLTGFGGFEFEKLDDGKEPSEPQDENYNAIFEIAVECEHEEEQSSVYNMLVEKGYKCRVLTM